MLVRKTLGITNEHFAQALILSSILLGTPLHAYEYIDEASLSDESSLVDAIQKGNASLGLRLRYEDARQDEKPEQGAQALTLRTRLAYQTQRFHMLSAYLQLDDVSAIPNDQNYNSGSNNELDDVFIGDPDKTRLSQAWLNFDLEGTAFKYGRQSAQLNTGRMLGSDDWQQNQQVFTGLSITNRSLNYTTISYADFHRIEQAYGKYTDDSDASLKARMLSLNYSGFLLNDFSIYYLAVSDHKRDRRWETQTTGIYFAGMAGGNNGIADSRGNRSGEDFSITYLFEYAKQQDKGKNPLNYNVDYLNIELGAGYQGGRFAMGREVLGADAEGSFVTPLANLHDFQGHAGQAVDQSLGSLGGGIVDFNMTLAFECSEGLSLSLTHHDYEFDKPQGQHKSIGSELETTIQYNFNQFELLAKYADYSADQIGEDTRRVWLQAAIKF